MRHRMITFLLLLCLSWQAFAFAGPATQAHGAGDATHALLHLHGETHHHHSDEGTAFQQDDSVESIQHVMADACLHWLALLPESSLGLPPLSSAAPAQARANEPSSPLLPGLERPPHLIA